VNATSLIRTLDQEVLALLRGASLECLVCGEFVQHRLGVIACPECGAAIQDGGEAKVQSKVQAG
jgi:Zn finger protein HypA/HybF involved in hydrogenase expression